MALAVGDIRVDPVIDGMVRYDPALVYAQMGADQWESHRSLLDDEGMLRNYYGGFLVRGPGHTTLVDLGLGPRTLTFTGAPARCGSLMGNLNLLGVEATEVTDVVFTHLHVDHVGWAMSETIEYTEDWQVVVEPRPTFPNATYRCSRADWQHFIVEHPGLEAERVGGVAGQLELWDGNATVLPGLDAVPAPGHTPGSSIIVISSGADRAMLIGDTVHCAVELVDDEWQTVGDIDPDLAMRTRAALNREIEGSNVPVAAGHFPELKFGRLVKAEGRRQWVF